MAAPVIVQITREIFFPDYTIIVDDGISVYSEELDPEAVRVWFRERGANMEEVEVALDYVWNFGNHKEVFVEIVNYTEPARMRTNSAAPLL